MKMNEMKLHTYILLLHLGLIKNCIFLAVKEAGQAFRIWKEHKENKEHQEVVKSEKKPAPYRFIKVSTI